MIGPSEIRTAPRWWPPKRTLAALILVWAASSAAASPSGKSSASQSQQAAAKLAAPEFSTPIGNVSAVAGRDVRLVCTVENLGQHQVAWLKEESKTILSIDTNIIITNYRIFLIPDEEGRKWVLHIKDVQESDRGYYQCQVNTNPMRSTSGYLEVVVPPTIIESETTQVVEAIENSNVTIQCGASGHPRPTISWRREDGEPIRLAGTGHLSAALRTTNSNSVLDLNDIKSDRLLFTSVDRTMSGLYVCTASNGIPSQVSRQIPLYVKFPPKVSISEKAIAINLGAQLEIDCLIEAFPKPTSYWSERQMPVQAFKQLRQSAVASRTGQHQGDGANDDDANADRLQGNSTTTTGAYVTVKQTALNAYTYKLRISIARMRSVDFGEYVCISTNSMGSSKARVLVRRVERGPLIMPSAAAVGSATQSRPSSMLEAAGAADNPSDYQRDSMGNEQPPAPPGVLLDNLGTHTSGSGGGSGGGGGGHQFIQASKSAGANQQHLSAEQRRSNFSMITRQSSRVYDENYLANIRNRQMTTNGYASSTLAHGARNGNSNSAEYVQVKLTYQIALVIIIWTLQYAALR